MTSESDRRLVVAYHESGHAFAAHMLGKRVVRITCVPTSERTGGIWWGEPPTSERLARPTIADIEETKDFAARLHKLLQLGRDRGPGAELLIEAADRAIIALAGPASEQRVCGGVFSYDVAKADLAEAEALAAAVALSPQSAWSYFRTFQIEARNLIERHWSAVVAVAERLAERGTLADDELTSFLTDIEKREASHVA